MGTPMTSSCSCYAMVIDAQILPAWPTLAPDIGSCSDRIPAGPYRIVIGSDLGARARYRIGSGGPVLVIG